MRRHYKIKHPYIFYKESEQSKSKQNTKRIKDKDKDIKNNVNEDNVNNEFVDIGSVETISQPTRKRNSALWQHFEELDKDFIRCKLCEMKLKDKHQTAVMHLNRRHSKEFSDLDDFNIMPFQQRTSLLWTFFVDEGNRFVRCKLCNRTMRKNMSKHLQAEHPDDFNKAMNCKRANIEKYYEQPPPRNWIKKYCTKIADKQHRCNECGLVLKLPDGLYGNMRRHVKNKHPNIYYTEMKLEKPVKVNTEDKTNAIDVSKDNDNSKSTKDPLADFDIGSPVMAETGMATSFIQTDSLESSFCSEIDLETIADLPALGPSLQLLSERTRTSYSPVSLSTDIILDDDKGVFRFNVSRRDLVDRVHRATPTAETVLDEETGRFRYLVLIPILYADQPAAVWFSSRFNLHYREGFQPMNRDPTRFSSFPFPPPLPPPPPPEGSPPPSPSLPGLAVLDEEAEFCVPKTPPLPPTPPPTVASKFFKPKSMFMKRLEKGNKDL